MAKAGKERDLFLQNEVPVVEAQAVCVELENIQCL